MRTLKLNKFALIGLTVLFLVSCIKDKHKVEGQNLSEIEKVLTSQTDAWNNGDIKGFMQGYEKSDSLQFITRKGRTVGWKKVYESYTKNYPTKKKMGTLHFKNLIIKPLADSVAQVYGNWVVQSDTIHSGNFSLIMKLKNTGWLIVIDHTW